MSSIPLERQGLSFWSRGNTLVLQGFLLRIPSYDATRRVEVTGAVDGPRRAMHVSGIVTTSPLRRCFGHVALRRVRAVSTSRAQQQHAAAPLRAPLYGAPRQRVVLDTRHATRDTRHATRDMRHAT